MPRLLLDEPLSEVKSLLDPDSDRGMQDMTRKSFPLCDINLLFDLDLTLPSERDGTLPSERGGTLPDILEVMISDGELT